MGDSRDPLLTAGAPPDVSPPDPLQTAGGSLLDDALAKRAQDDPQDEAAHPCRQSYRGHVVAVYQAWRELNDVHAQTIERVARRHGLTFERLLQSSLLCVALHDLGKLSENFQRMMRASDEAAYKAAVRLNYRHEVIPVCLIHSYARRLPGKPIVGGGLLETLAVAGHHKYLAPQHVFNRERYIQNLVWPGYDPIPNLRAGFELAQAMFAEQGWTLPPLTKKRQPSAELRRRLTDRDDPIDYLLSQKDQFTLNVERDGTAAAARELFTLLKGLLMTADWIASGTPPDERPDVLKGVVKVPAAQVRTHLASKVAAGGRGTFDDFRLFQRQCGDASGHVLAVAPTGSGKTEAALLWALRQIEAGHVSKLLFLLPTMVTANSLHGRLEDFFKPRGHEVGLVHSTAELIRENFADEEPSTRGAAKAEVKHEVFRAKHLFPPVVAGTVDQLLTPLLHAGRWPMKTLAAGGAAVVIDEVHAYDPHTAGLISLIIEQLRPLGTRFLVMSATLPDDLHCTLAASLTVGDDETPLDTVRDEELLNQARNCWSVAETPLEGRLTKGVGDDARPTSYLRRLLRKTNDRGGPLRVLVVVNTVKRCQQLASALREFAPVCYHSKFIFDDRRDKERQILDCRPRLLIATQVVEVSLDIDYDLLLTECAPIDALVQRAGRVNRPRRRKPGRVIVHPADDASQKVYDPETVSQTWDILRKHDGARLTERQLLDLVERVYAGRRLAEHPQYVEVRSATLQHQQRLSGVLDSPRPDEENALGKTRLESYPQVSVIPKDFLAEVYCDRCKRDNGQRRRYELKMPVWYARMFHLRDRSTNPDDLPLVEMDYDTQLGGRFLDDPDHGSTGSQII